MTKETVKQAALAYLRRLPESEWGNFWRIGETLFGEAKGATKNISLLSDALYELAEEGLVRRSGHTGWRAIT